VTFSDDNDDEMMTMIVDL